MTMRVMRNYDTNTSQNIFYYLLIFCEKFPLTQFAQCMFCMFLKANL